MTTIKAQKISLDWALAQAGRALTKYPPVPVLAGVLLKNGYAVCNDLELCIRARFADAAQEYAILLPPEIIPIVKNMAGDEITITAEPGKKAVITDGFARVTLPAAGQAEEYPDDTGSTSADMITEIRATTLHDLAAKTLFAVSRELSREAFRGVKITVDEHSLTAAASDTYRLSLYRCSVDSQRPASFLLPARAIREAARMRGDKIEIRQAKNNHVVFADTVGQNMIVSRIIEEKFPDFTRVIPTETQITTTRSDNLLQALNLCQLVGTVARLEISNERIKIQAEGDAGKVEDEVSCAGTANLKLLLNAKFLAEGLAVAVEEPDIHTSGENNPMYISQKNWQYLVMAIKDSSPNES